MTSKEAEKKDKLKLQKRFGDHLKRLRESMGLTPAELARRCYMERSNIARLETGRMNPSLFIIKKLSDGLDLTITQLLEGFK
jgi:transcriptional regulator with XRE-family HTH domain